MRQSLYMFRTDPGWQRGFQHLADWRRVIVRNPAAKVENIGPQQRDRIENTADLMHLDIRGHLFPEADHKPFHFSLPEGNNNSAAGFHGCRKFVDKGSRQRQAHRDVGVHR